MRRLPVLVGLLCAFCGVALAQRGAAQRPPEPMTTQAAVYLYAGGDRAVVVRNAPTFLPPIWTIGDDLARLPKLVSVNPAVAPLESGRAVAAFAVEAARALETQSTSSVCEVILGARTRWVPSGSKSEFARRWHAAAIATLLRGDCLAAMDTSVSSALEDFPTEPKFRLARAVAAEQQLAEFFAAGGRPPARALRDAETRFKIAMAMPGVSAEASLRWARINAQLGQHEQAIGFTAEALASKEVRLRYLAHLFRGWSLAALDKFADADAEYGKALALVPDAQTASLARAAAAFRSREPERSARIIDALASRATPAEDPWWTYSIGDGRLVDQAIADLRQVIR